MRLTTGLVLWIVAAGAATAVGLAAVAAIGTDIFGAGQDPLSQSEVDELLTSHRPPPVTTSSSPSTTTPTTTSTPATTTPPPPADTPTVTAGGTVISHCTPDGLVQIVSSTPAQGYQIDHEDSLEDHPSVKFTNGEQKVEVRLRCVNGVPSPEVKIDDD